MRRLPSVRDEGELVRGLQNGEVWARAALYDRYASGVERTLRRVLGPELHTEMADVVHDVFVQAFASIQRLRDAEALVGWLQGIAVHTAYRTIRARHRRRWLRFWEPERIPEVAVDGLEPDVLEAYRRTYAVLSRMPSDERVMFALRYIDGLEVLQIAGACDVSLSTVKRRLASAERRFSRAAERDPVLKDWVEGARWKT